MFASILATAIDLVPTIFNLLIVVGLFVLAPMTIFRRTRPIAAVGFLIAAIMLAHLLWFSSELEIFRYWGVGGVVASLIFWIPGAAIVAVFVTILYGTGTELLGLMIMIFATVIVGFVAFRLQKTRAVIPSNVGI